MERLGQAVEDVLCEGVGKKHGSVEKESGEGPLLPFQRKKNRFNRDVNS